MTATSEATKHNLSWTLGDIGPLLGTVVIPDPYNPGGTWTVELYEPGPNQPHAIADGHLAMQRRLPDGTAELFVRDDLLIRAMLVQRNALIEALETLHHGHAARVILDGLSKGE